MYIELPQSHDFFRFIGSNRYRYIPVDITPQNFHRNRRDDSLLIVDSPVLSSAVCEEFARAYGKINIMIPDYDVYGSYYPRTPSLHLRLKKYFPDDEDYIITDIILTDEELTALVRMRYPKESKRADFMEMALDEYHEATNGTIMHIKIDNPPHGLTELFENSHSGS